MLLGKLKVPNENFDLSNGSKEEINARKQNELGYSEILLSMQDPVCITVVDDARTTDRPNGDTKLAWEQLKDLFAPKYATSKMILKRDFANCNLNNAQDPDE